MSLATRMMMSTVQIAGVGLHILLMEGEFTLRTGSHVPIVENLSAKSVGKLTFHGVWF